MVRAHRPVPNRHALLAFHLADKRGIDAACPAFFDADGAHCVKAQRVERTQVHIRKIPCLVRVCVDASYAAEAVDVAHKAHLLHMDGVIVPDADIFNFANAGNIDQHLAVDDRGEVHQRIANLVREKLVRGHLHIVEQHHFVEDDVPNAARIAVNFSFHTLLCLFRFCQNAVSSDLRRFFCCVYHTIPPGN